MARKRITRTVELEWNEAAVREFTHDPNSDLGERLLRRCGEIVLAGAKRRALKRTGRMADAMYFEVGTGPEGLSVAIISPAEDPRSHNFPYAIVHEGAHVRDRRAHRSLRPALLDIRHIEAGGWE